MCGIKFLSAEVGLRKGRFFFFDSGSLGEVGEILTLGFGGFLNVLFDLFEFLSEVELILGIGVLAFEEM